LVTELPASDTSHKTQTSVKFTSWGRKEVSLCQIYRVFIHTLPNRTLNHYVLILLTWKKPAFNLLCLWQWINSHVQPWQLTYDSVMLLLCFALHVIVSHRSSSMVGANPWKECYDYVSGIFSSSDRDSKFFQTFDASIPQLRTRRQYYHIQHSTAQHSIQH